jgi:glycosidase
MPQLYSGNELYMAGYQDPDNRRDFPGGFAGGKGDVFQSASRTPVQAEMFEWTSRLLAVRKATPALQTGALQILYTSTDSIVYTRTDDRQHVLIALHRGSEDVTLHVPTENTSLAGLQNGTALFGGGSVRSEKNGITIELPANGALITSMQ